MLQLERYTTYMFTLYVIKYMITVAILAQGTHWAVANSQAFCLLLTMTLVPSLGSRRVRLLPRCIPPRTLVGATCHAQVHAQSNHQRWKPAHQSATNKHQIVLAGCLCVGPLSVCCLVVCVLFGCLCVGCLCVGCLSVCWLVVCVLVGCLCVGWLSVCWLVVFELLGCLCVGWLSGRWLVVCVLVGCLCVV
jgi:hypothetical protein